MASYGVESFKDAVINLAQTTMRSEIGRLSLDSLFQEREKLNEKIVSAIEKESKEWGVHSIRYEIKDIEAPNAIQKSMVLEAEAERRKRASILTSEGEKLANINIADAEKQA
jgi:regulator of protease activity HflC (stomatin/prohibitin superfamily)